MRIIKIALFSFLLASVVMFSNISYAADSAEVKKIVKELTKGKKAISSKVTLRAPVIAENGDVIPISFSVKSPMTKNNYVKSVYLLITGNPNPRAFRSNLTPEAGAAAFSTRIRMGKTSEVRAYAVMSDGKVYVDKKTVKVTIGGCG